MSAVMEKPQRPHTKTPQGESVNTRLAVLETRWEEIIPTLATKADLMAAKADLERGQGGLRADLERFHGGLRTDLERAHGGLLTELYKVEARIMRWFLTTIVVFFVGFSGIFFAMQRNLDTAVSRIERVYAAVQTAPPTTPAQDPPDQARDP